MPNRILYPKTASGSRITENGTIRKRLEDFCEETRDRFPDCPFGVERIRVETGHPVDQILRCVEEIHADMVVMGSRGQSVLADVTMGSTSRRVLRRCKKPVIIIRLPEPDG